MFIGTWCHWLLYPILNKCSYWNTFGIFNIILFSQSYPSIKILNLEFGKKMTIPICWWQLNQLFCIIIILGCDAAYVYFLPYANKEYYLISKSSVYVSLLCWATKWSEVIHQKPAYILICGHDQDVLT